MEEINACAVNNKIDDYRRKWLHHLDRTELFKCKPKGHRGIGRPFKRCLKFE
jgi:hypothetical protein